MLKKKTYILIGKPFELDQFYGIKLDDETLAKANDIVRDKMLELREEVLEKKNKKNKGKK